MNASDRFFSFLLLWPSVIHTVHTYPTRMNLRAPIAERSRVQRPIIHSSFPHGTTWLPHQRRWGGGKKGHHAEQGDHIFSAIKCNNLRPSWGGKNGKGGAEVRQSHMNSISQIYFQSPRTENRAEVVVGTKKQKQNYHLPPNQMDRCNRCNPLLSPGVRFCSII